MIRTELPKEPTVEALTAVWASLRALIGELADEDWSMPTALPGWDVAAVIPPGVSHALRVDGHLRVAIDFLARGRSIPHTAVKQE